MYDDLMVTGDAGSLIAWAILVVVVAGGIWFWKNRKK